MEENNNNNEDDDDDNFTNSQVIELLKKKIDRLEKKIFKRKDIDHRPSNNTNDITNRVTESRATQAKRITIANTNEKEELKGLFKARENFMFLTRLIGINWMLNKEWRTFGKVCFYKIKSISCYNNNSSSSSDSTNKNNPLAHRVVLSSNEETSKKSINVEEKSFIWELFLFVIFCVRLCAFIAAIIGFIGNIYMNIHYSIYFWRNCLQAELTLDKIYRIILKAIAFNVTPLFQVGTIIYTLVKLNKELDDKNPRDTTRLTPEFIDACKTDSFLAFLPFTITLILAGSWYDN